jgi:hypothetical protein
VGEDLLVPNKIKNFVLQIVYCIYFTSYLLLINSTNSRKILDHLFDEFSICFLLQSDHIQALYYRGITWMAVGTLKNAKTDLWEANKHCITQHNVAMKKQVSTTWKRLQALFTRKTYTSITL